MIIYAIQFFKVLICETLVEISYGFLVIIFLVVSIQFMISIPIKLALLNQSPMIIYKHLQIPYLVNLVINQYYSSLFFLIISLFCYCYNKEYFLKKSNDD